MFLCEAMLVFQCSSPPFSNVVARQLTAGFMDILITAFYNAIITRVKI